MANKLDKIRERIDTLDNKIHDLLMERAELVSDVAAEKRKHNLQIVHPAREAQMIRRLLARHKNILPQQAVVRIWRELVGAVSLLQSGLKVVVCDPQGDGAYWDMARNYFGSVIPMQKTANPLSSLAAVREGAASFAVVPWPMENETSSWWSLLGHQDSDKPIRIVCALPYGSAGENSFATSTLRALVISKIDFIESGLDNSFILAELAPEVSRARLHDLVIKAGLEPISINTLNANEFAKQVHHLIEVNGYLEEDSEKLAELTANFDTSQSYFSVIGGYPAPPEYDMHPNQHSEPLQYQSPPKKVKKAAGKK